MTDEQATAELKYRLAKYIILTLRDKGMVTQQVAELAIRDLCEQYHAMFFDRHMEHLAGRCTIDIATSGKYLLPPLLPGNPGNDPGLDGRKVCDEETVTGLGNECRADQLGKNHRDGVIEKLDGIAFILSEGMFCVALHY